MRGILGELVAGAGEVTIMDMEASLEHLSRGTVRYVDALLIVVEPYYRALETAGRTVPLARGLGLERIYGVANKLRGAQDEGAVVTYCRNHDLELVARIPFDESVLEADRVGRALIDYDLTSPVIEEVSRLADFLQREVKNDGTGGTRDA